MNDLLWVGPVVVTLLLAFFSLYARRWWFAPYLGAVMFVFVCGVYVSAWPKLLQHVWWDGWGGYMVTLPILRIAGWPRRRDRWDDAA